MPLTKPDPIQDAFKPEEFSMLIEALAALRTVKVDAMNTVNASGFVPANRPFQPHDFGIPLIDRLLTRLQDADEGCEEAA